MPATMSRDELWTDKRNAATRLREIHSASLALGRAMTQEEEARYSEAADRIQEIEDLMAQEDRHASLMQRLNEPDPAQRARVQEPETGRSVLASQEYRDAFGAWARRRERADHLEVLSRGADREERTLSALTGAAGGYLIPTTMANFITETRAFYGGAIESGIQVITTSTGEDIHYPTNDDTGNIGEMLAEGGTVSAQDVSFGNRKLSAYVASSKLVKVPLVLLADSAFDIESFLGRVLATRLGRLRNRKLTTGLGTGGEPQGMVTGSTSGVTAASATAVTYNELLDLEHSVDPAYRDPSVCRYMWADATFKAVRKLVDGQSRPLWEPAVQNGPPSTFNNYRYVLNNEMPAMTTGQKSILFGDFNSYYICRMVGGMVAFRLSELYKLQLQDGFFAVMRFDGGVIDAAAVRALTQA